MARLSHKLRAGAFFSQVTKPIVKGRQKQVDQKHRQTQTHTEIYTYPTGCDVCACDDQRIGWTIHETHKKPVSLFDIHLDIHGATHYAHGKSGV